MSELDSLIHIKAPRDNAAMDQACDKHRKMLADADLRAAWLRAHRRNMEHDVQEPRRK